MPHPNHQTWHNGRNEVRYVPASEVAALQKAIQGYRFFIKLAEQYVDKVIRLTRRARKRETRQQETTPSNSTLQHN